MIDNTISKIQVAGDSKILTVSGYIKVADYNEEELIGSNGSYGNRAEVSLLGPGNLPTLIFHDHSTLTMNFVSNTPDRPSLLIRQYIINCEDELDEDFRKLGEYYSIKGLKEIRSIGGVERETITRAGKDAPFPEDYDNWTELQQRSFFRGMMDNGAICAEDQEFINKCYFAVKDLGVFPLYANLGDKFQIMCSDRVKQGKVFGGVVIPGVGGKMSIVGVEEANVGIDGVYEIIAEEIVIDDYLIGGVDDRRMEMERAEVGER